MQESSVSTMGKIASHCLVAVTWRVRLINVEDKNPILNLTSLMLHSKYIFKNLSEWNTMVSTSDPLPYWSNFKQKSGNIF
jgi:hypothetical protein